MKKNFTTLASFIFIFVSSFFMVSCELDDDHEIAASIDGCWRGEMQFYNSWEGHKYSTTEIEFVPDHAYSTYGTGYWVDYYDNWRDKYYICNDIEWKVRNGNIYVYFVQERTEIVIYDYRLTNRYFDGYLDDNGNRVSFRLDRVSSPYYNTWASYIPVYYSSYAKSNNVKAANDSLNTGDIDYSGVTFNRTLQK